MRRYNNNINSNKNALFRPTESRVLKNMRHPSVIVGIRLEPRGKHVIPVFPRNVDVLGARLVVGEMNRRQLQFGHGLCALDGEAVELVAGEG